ncbi:thyroid receptor interactor trip15 [Aphelenchoides avenae]|nr:thyroid receptor interactor trip15 [Aphelenchus avenae]
MAGEHDYEYADGGSDSSRSADELEDLYENAKSLKSEGNIDEAVAEFMKIVEKDTQKSEQGFRALKQLFKVAKAKDQFVYALVLYDQLLAYARDSPLVSRSKIDKAIGNIVDRHADSSAHHFTEQILAKTAGVFRPLPDQKAPKHERLWFLATKKLVETRLSAERMSVLDLSQVETYLEALHSRLKDESGADRLDKSSRLWEVYALRMRLACRQEDHKQLELLVGRVLQLTSNVNHPETIAFVGECTAYVQFRKSRYTQAYFAFDDAFNHYEQAGSSKRTKCLAYMVLLSILANTPVAPLTLATTQVLSEEPVIRAASQLLEAYLCGGSSALLVAYCTCKAPLRSDAFVKEVIDVIVLRTW